ncbi:UNVERIFIED_CONTAM: hypothetical protein Scaly_3061400 [Sesamum calycinum]|uniref:Transposase MuDR plant domain-containing protein n=1 Tax=Sesamum calycinum TaxID=2727403 RepID=A0AAW2K098_9LAMI
MKSNKGKGKEVDKHGGFVVFNSNLDNGDPQFEVGLCFPDTQSFRDAVRQHSIINARDVVFTKNDKNKVQVKCKHDTCKWYIFASKIHGEDTMQVNTLHNEHQCTRVVDFEKIMNELRGKDLEAFKWLAKRPTVQWSRSYFRCNAQCDILLNNMCESFNATIVEARSRPIVDMLETIRMMLMKRVYVKRDQIKNTRES